MRLTFQLPLAFSLIVLAAAFTSTGAQQSGPCPKVTISYAEQPFGADGVRTFHAQLVDAIPGKSVYFNWSGNFGKSLTENGLPSLMARENADERGTIYVDVLGEGIPKGCIVQDYRILQNSDAPVDYPYDDILSGLPEEQETLRWEVFAKQVSANPDSRAYVVVEGAKGAPHSAVSEKMQKIRWFLSDERGIAPERIILVEGRTSEEPAVMLWVVSAGAKLPEPYENDRPL